MVRRRFQSKNKLKPQIKIKYQDSLAKKRKRSRIAKISAYTALIVAGISGLTYLIFFTPWLRIDNVNIVTDERKIESISRSINEYLDKDWLSLVPIRRNILFMSKSNLEDYIYKSFDGLVNVSIDKDFPHSINIKADNRQSVMIWCFTSSCHYVDEDGKLWGVAPESSGFLIPVIKDLRTNQSLEIKPDLLLDIENIFSVLNSLKIPVENILIKEGVFEEIEVVTAKKYSLYMTKEFNVSDQLETFSIFISQNPNLIPEYMDLRIPGRVYYKNNGQ